MSDNMPKIVVEYGGRYYEVSFYDMHPDFRRQLEAGMYRALSGFHGDFTSIFDIKALINDYLAESGHPWPEQLIEALKK